MNAKRTAMHRKMVHRRRRTLALAAVLAVVLVVTIAVWRPWEPSGASEAETPAETPAAETPTPTPTASPEPSQPFTPVGGVPEGEDGEGGACAPEQVTIAAVVDAPTYQPDQPVQMSFRIENVSDAPCSLNVGTTQQEYEVRTGEQVVYRSTDCPVDPVDQVVELQPHTPQETLPIEWDRTFSSEDTCTSPREHVVAGGASYHLSVSVSGIAATETAQFILY